MVAHPIESEAGDGRPGQTKNRLKGKFFVLFDSETFLRRTLHRNIGRERSLAMVAERHTGGRASAEGADRTCNGSWWALLMNEFVA
jgi:hypothetical protein